MALGVMMTSIVAAVLCAASGTTIYDATLAETTEKSVEISTAEMKQVLENKTAVVFDSRPARARPACRADIF